MDSVVKKSIRIVLENNTVRKEDKTTIHVPPIDEAIDCIFEVNSISNRIYMTLKYEQCCKESKYSYAFEFKLGNILLQKENFKKIDFSEMEVLLSNLSIREIRGKYSQNNIAVRTDIIYLKLDLTIKCERISPLQQLFLDFAAPELADFTFEIADEKIPAHKYILSARSPVFNRMLSNDCYQETQQSVMRVTETSPEIFKLFLKFLYQAIITSQSMSIAIELIKLADRYDVATLKRVCESQMIKGLRESNCLTIYTFAHQHNCSQKLIGKAFDLVQKKYFVGKNLPPNLSENPDEVQLLVTKMEEFDNVLQEVSEELSNPSKKMRKS